MKRFGVTRIRLNVSNIEDWEYCPICRGPLEIDQSTDKLTYDGLGQLNVEDSKRNGFAFNLSAKHCGLHIRLWIALDENDEGDRKQ